jgi:hypothetical protein
MKCTNCNLDVAPHSKVLVVYKHPDGVLLSWKCEHFPFNESDQNIVAVLASADCSLDWFIEWRMEVLHCQDERHKAAREVKR